MSVLYLVIRDHTLTVLRFIRGEGSGVSPTTHTSKAVAKPFEAVQNEIPLNIYRRWQPVNSFNNFTLYLINIFKNIVLAYGKFLFGTCL